jgi:dTDP-4-amino-4,6-dideoxygalactose transaminase
MIDNFLPFCRPSIGKEEEDAVLEVMRSGWLTTGARALQFEKDFAEFKHCKHAVATNSCTSALHLALVALGIGPGDEVITTPITWPSTVNVIIHCGATPVFVDVESDTLNVDAKKIWDRVTKRTKAILPVHLAGHPCDMSEINKLASIHKLFVVEDAAHALEAEYKGRKTGTLGDVGCFSFYPTKNLTTAEGGILTTNNDEVAEKAKLYGFQGIDRDAWKRYGTGGYKHWEAVVPGYKYNMPDLTAAIGIVQLRKVWEFWKRRVHISNTYDVAFAGDNAVRPLTISLGQILVASQIVHSHHLYIVVLDTDRLTADRDTIMNAIQAENIGIGIHFRALHLMRAYQNLGYRRGDLPNAEYASDRLLSLPLYPAMTDEDIQDVIVAVKKVISKYRKVS